MSKRSDYTPFLRQPRVLLPVFGLLLGALILFTFADNAVNRGITYIPSAAPIAWADTSRLGVNAYNIQFEAEPAKVTRTLELARDLGAHYVRMQMPWEDLEIHSKGDFEDRRSPEHIRSAWEKYDFIVSEATRLGLDLIVRLDRPPLWARAQANASLAFQEGLQIDGNSTGPPDHLADYTDFVHTVVARYRGKVCFFQIWNEPNLKNEWNWRTPSPQEFVELLRAAYTAAKAANPDAVILFPSLSPTDGLDKKAPMSELEYLDQVYALGGAAYFDIMSAQAYGLGQPPDEHRYIFLRNSSNWNWGRPIDTRIDVSRVVLLREVMERNGDSAKAIWISEFGYNSAPESIPERARVNWGQPVSEEQKGEYLIGQLERARDEWPWMGVMNVWFLRWGGPDPNPQDSTPYFAIVQPDFTPLPAYKQLQSFMATGPVAGVGAHIWSNPAVTALGEQRWTIRFHGQSFSLLHPSGPLEVSIDGGPIQAFNPSMERQALPITSHLADGDHVVTVYSVNGAPSGFIVGRAVPWGWLWNVIPTLLLLALAVVGALLARGLPH